MFLESDIYSPNGTTFQITPADLAQHVSWMKTVNAKLPSGSNYFVEIGHNGNGNIEVPQMCFTSIINADKTLGCSGH
jgi:hypothetical protein